MGKVYGNSTTVTYGTGGTPLVTSSSGLGTPYTYGGVGVDTVGPAVKGNVTVPLGNTGKSVQVVAKSAIPRANFAKGLVKLAKLGRVTPGGLLAGLAIDAMIDYGLKNVRLGDDGSLVADGDPANSEVSTGQVWKWNATGGPWPTGNTAEGLCAKVANGGQYQYSNYFCQAWDQSGNYLGGASVSPSAGTCPAGNYIWPNGNCSVSPAPMTEQELSDFLAARTTGWPTSSALALASMLGEPSIRTDLDPQPAGIVGPMTVPGATSKSTESVKLVPGTNVEAPPGATQTDPGTKTTTSTKTHPITYNGPEVKYGTVTNNVTNITNNVTNVTTTETTKTEEAEDDNQPDQCEKHPDSLACQKIDLDTPEGEIPKSKASVTYSIEDSWGGGSCPADVYTNVGGQSIKAYDWQQTCGYVATYVRPILYLLCAFGALWIVMPGKADA